MPSTATSPTREALPDTPAGLLAAARESRVAADAEEARILELAAAWADLHPPESIHDNATFPVAGGEGEVRIAGQGCPGVAEFCVAELGAVLGMSTTAAKRLIGHALELRHRLPRLHAQVHAGRVPAWRARVVAEATIHTTPALTMEAADWVDAQVAAVAGKVGTAQLERLLAEAIKRYGLTAPVDPADDPDLNDGHGVDPRHVTVDIDHVHYAGTLRIEAELDLADGLDLDHAVAQGAAARKALGCTESLDARRAMALGDLARTQTSLDLAGPTGRDTTNSDNTHRDNPATGAHSPGEHGAGSGGSSADSTVPVRPTLPAARQLVLHIHLSAAAITDEQITLDPLGRLEEGQRLLLLEQIRGWCADSHTKITIKPVIDLNAGLAAPGYAIPDRIREQVILRDRTCVFPHCTRPARRCQVDHIIPFDHQADAEGRPQPGPTETDNLAALCTGHHRLKTHTGWRYRMLAPGVFEWTSPHGHHYLRDHHGTTPLDAAPETGSIDFPRPRPPDRP